MTMTSIASHRKVYRLTQIGLVGNFLQRTRAYVDICLPINSNRISWKQQVTIKPGKILS